MTVRIMHVTQPVEAGVAVVLADLAEHQAALGWEVHVACPPGGWLDERLGRSPVHLHAWDATRSPGRSVMAEARSLRRLCRRTDPDVVHLHSSKAGLAGRLALRGRLPTVFQPHAWSFHAADGQMRRASTWWERHAVQNWTDLLIAVSHGELADGLGCGIEARNSVVIPNGVDVRRFSPGDRDRARRRLELPDGPLVLCIGRLARQKGQDLALDAWRQVHAELPEAHLAIVGDGPDRPELVRRMLPGSSLHGGTTHPEEWFTAADLVVMPSRWEGMALVPLEAMSCGRPVVGFDVAGVAESIGDAGTAVPAGDADALASALLERLRDPRRLEEEGRRARLRVLNHYDRGATVARTTEAVSELLARVVPGRSPASGVLPTTDAIDLTTGAVDLRGFYPDEGGDQRAG